jgi:inhibitor of cysteine peptidase
MKFRITLLFAVLLVSLLMSSCIITSHDIEVEITCGQFNENHHATGDFQMEVGDKIRVKLCSDATTGFRWQYDINNENILKEEDHDFIEPEGDDLAGAAGQEVWTFEAVEKGTTEVRMEYSQPWEGGVKAEWTYTFTVTVE